MTPLNEIDAKTKAYADARAKLGEFVEVLKDGIEALKRDALPRIKRQLVRATELQAELQALVVNAPDLFVRPKTMVLHGIKVGFEKGKGTVEFEDADQVVALIRKKLPDLADVLIKTDSKPLKKPLSQLTVQQLKSIGCTVDEAGDHVVVRAIGDDVDKLVAALLKESTPELEPA